MIFDTVHIVRRYGARRYFSTDQLIPHREKRLLYGLPPYSTVRCGAFFVFYDAVRCGFFFLESYGAVRCGFVRGKIVRCGAVRLNRTETNRTTTKHRTVKVLLKISFWGWEIRAAVELHKNPRFCARTDNCLAPSAWRNTNNYKICSYAYKYVLYIIHSVVGRRVYYY